MILFGDLVGAWRFELQTSCAQGRRATSGKSFLSNFTSKSKNVSDNFGIGSGTVYKNAAPHAWSPPNFPHSEDKAKV